MGFIIFIFIIIVILILHSFLSNKARKERIYQKYGHTEIAERIINKMFWVGQTSEQLQDSLGKPIDIDENVLKTKKKETWKYCQKSANRFGLKIRVENGIVVGWDERL